MTKADTTGMDELRADASLIVRGVLHDVIADLEKGKLKHKDPARHYTSGFSMARWIHLVHRRGPKRTSEAQPCGTIACLGGHCELRLREKVGTERAARVMVLAKEDMALYELFYPTPTTDYTSITPSMAIDAARNFLNKGAAKWAAVLKAHGWVKKQTDFGMRWLPDDE